MKIVGIAGMKGVGKNTLAKMIAGDLKSIEIAFADPIKRSAMGIGFSSEALWGDSEARKQIHPALGITARTYCQKEGEFWRSQDPDHWVKLFAGAVSIVKIGGRYHRETGPFHWDSVGPRPGVLFVTDLRHQNEHDYLKSIGAKTILLQRPGTDDGDPHPSEVWCRETAAGVVDHVIVNDKGLSDLFAAATEICSWIADET